MDRRTDLAPETRTTRPVKSGMSRVGSNVLEKNIGRKKSWIIRGKVVMEVRKEERDDFLLALKYVRTTLRSHC